MKIRFAFGVAACLAAQPALAAPPKPQFGDPVKVSETLTFDPIVDLRLRYEHVDQPTLDADALTIRLRAGGEFKHKSGLSLLVEGEGTLGVLTDYNAFPFAIVDTQRRTGFAVVADPMNVELNRAQLQYKSKKVTLTLGRQRIVLDDQRWVGNVGWRQNEQTFEALRGEAKLGKLSLDAAYAIDQRTIWGIDAGPRAGMTGDFVLLGAGGKLGPVALKGFAYLLDYDEAPFVSFSSQTYGARASGTFALGKSKLSLTASYARQSDYGSNPFVFSADYFVGEAALNYKALTLTGGWEQLGSNNGRAVQTPMATLHKFNGWADLFLTTPANALRDAYAGVAWKLDKVKALPGLNFQATYHQFDSAVGSIDYGSEWDASAGFKLGRVALQVKYADYNAAGFGQDTRKLWLQAELAL